MIKLTSLLSFLETKQERKSQTQLLAEWIVTESQAGRPVWIRRIANVAGKRYGLESLLQISSASARLNELRKKPFTVDGIEYRLLKTPNIKCMYTSKMVETYKAMTQAEMIEYFNTLPYEVTNETEV